MNDIYTILPPTVLPNWCPVAKYEPVIVMVDGVTQSNYIKSAFSCFGVDPCSKIDLALNDKILEIKFNIKTTLDGGFTQ